jgi:hypothetical protein
VVVNETQAAYSSTINYPVMKMQDTAALDDPIAVTEEA